MVNQKKMFKKNQIRIKDFFIPNPRTSRPENSESALDSGQNSAQYQYSQLDYAESQLQDAGSQLSSTSSESPKKFYGMYGNKPSVFARKNIPVKHEDIRGREIEKRNLNSRPIMPKKRSSSVGPKLDTSFQEQLRQNKAMLQEREERELVNNMLKCMKECALEVKTAVDMVKDNVQLGITTTQNSVTDHLEKLQKDLDKHKDEMVKALQIRDEMKEKIATLMQTISAKDSQIAHLEGQVQEFREEQNRKIIQDLQKSFFDGIEDTKDHITQAYNEHNKEITSTTRTQEAAKNEIMQHAKKLHNKALDQNLDSLREFHARVHEDLQISKNLDQKERGNFEMQLKGQIEQIQRHQREDIRALLKQQMMEMDQLNEDKQKESFQLQMKELDELQQQHKTQINQEVQKQLREADSEQKLVVKNMIEELWQKENKNAHLIQREQQRNIEEEIQKRCENELEQMRCRHANEVKEILTQQESFRQKELEKQAYIHEQEINKQKESMQQKYANKTHCSSVQTIELNEVFDFQPRESYNEGRVGRTVENNRSLNQQKSRASSGYSSDTDWSSYNKVKSYTSKSSFHETNNIRMPRSNSCSEITNTFYQNKISVLEPPENNAAIKDPDRGNRYYKRSVSFTEEKSPHITFADQQKENPAVLEPENNIVVKEPDRGNRYYKRSVSFAEEKSPHVTFADQRKEIQVSDDNRMKNQLLSDVTHDGFKAPTGTSSRSPWSRRKVGSFGQKSSAFNSKTIFVSPLLAKRSWTSKELFCKIQPSPVAKVLPQIKGPGNQPKTVEDEKSKPQTRSRTNAVEVKGLAVSPNVVDKPATVEKKKPKKRRKKAAYTSRKKKPKSKSESQKQEVLQETQNLESAEESDEESTQYISNRYDVNVSNNNEPPPKRDWINKSQQKSYQKAPKSESLSVFEFTDLEEDTRGKNTKSKREDREADAKWKAVCNIQPKKYSNRNCTENKRPLLSSPDILQDDDCSSICSSPSFSVADILLKTKAQDQDYQENQEKSPYSSLQCDFLSTPNLIKESLQDSFELELDNTQSKRNNRESGKRRKLTEDPIVSCNNIIESTRKTRRK